MGTLNALDIAGENAVVDVNAAKQPLRGATLTVESDFVELLRLQTADWKGLVQSGIMGGDVLSGISRGLKNRERSNVAALISKSKMRTRTQSTGVSATKPKKEA